MWHKRIQPPLLVSLSLAVILEIAVRLGWLPITVPPPSGIIQALVEDFDDLIYHMLPTVMAAATGLMLAALVAALATSIASSFATSERSIFSIGILIDSMPLIALAPMFMLFLGNGLTLHITIAAIACHFPLLIGMLQGAKATTSEADELFHVLAASRLQRLRLLALPSALPYLFAAFKIAAPLAVLGALIAEWMGAERGLGMMMVMALFSFDVETVWLTILSVCGLAMAGYGLATLAEARCVTWHHDQA